MHSLARSPLCPSHNTQHTPFSPSLLQQTSRQDGAFVLSACPTRTMRELVAAFPSSQRLLARLVARSSLARARRLALLAYLITSLLTAAPRPRSPQTLTKNTTFRRSASACSRPSRSSSTATCTAAGRSRRPRCVWLARFARRARAARRRRLEWGGVGNEKGATISSAAGCAHDNPARCAFSAGDRAHLEGLIVRSISTLRA